jgi:predicted RNase H-like HicB family nuclease
MQYRAIVKPSDGWWIGWLVDLPGVNAQERTRDAVIESLRIGAEDMLATQVSFAPDSTMVVVQVSNPKWAAESA